MYCTALHFCLNKCAVIHDRITLLYKSPLSLPSILFLFLYLSRSRLELELERDKRERDARERELRERELREMEIREKFKADMEMKPPGTPGSKIREFPLHTRQSLGIFSLPSNFRDFKEKKPFHKTLSVARFQKGDNSCYLFT